jgi:hypothetical protein
VSKLKCVKKSLLAQLTVDKNAYYFHHGVQFFWLVFWLKGQMFWLKGRMFWPKVQKVWTKAKLFWRTVQKYFAYFEGEDVA